MQNPLYLSVGSIIIDDIILPDGASQMGSLGGGATHAVMGMRAWSESVGLVAGVGKNFPRELTGRLEAAFDLRGLVVRENLPTTRAWQIFEFDGHRTEIFRTSLADFRDINPLPTELPAELFKARGVHLQPEAPQPLLQWIELFRAGGDPFILWEPWDQICTADHYPVIRQIFPLVDCFSPNLEEARAITGLNSPQEIVKDFQRYGAKIVALRMGSLGSLLASGSGALLHVPVVPVERIVDHTGAGNAYCGGLIVGMVETGQLSQAARWAAISASLALEQFGALIPLNGLHQRAVARLSEITIPNIF